MEPAHLNALRALEATLRNGSFSTAAREIGVTPATLWQQGRGLEEYIGRSLFEREAGALRPLSDAEAETEALTRAFRSLSACLSPRGLRHPSS